MLTTALIADSCRLLYDTAADLPGFELVITL